MQKDRDDEVTKDEQNPEEPPKREKWKEEGEPRERDVPRGEIPSGYGGWPGGPARKPGL